MKATQWGAFLRRNQLDVDGASFAQVIADLATFLLPPVQALAKSSPFIQHWTPATKWQD